MTFASQVKINIDASKQDMDRIVRGTLLGIYRDTILDTPVDTGRLRNNWFTTIGRPTAGQRDPKGKGAGDAIANAVNVSRQFPMGSTVFFTNNLPYASTIELGGIVNGGIREGRGMLRRAIANRTRGLR